MNKIIKFTALAIAVMLMASSFAACTATVSEVAVDEVTEDVTAKDTADNANTENTEKYSVTFYADEVPAFVADQIIKSTKVYDSNNDVDLGLVTDVLCEDAICYASDAGKLVLTTKAGYRSLIITTTVDATQSLEGWYIGDTLYGIGHKDTLHVGNLEVELTLRSFEALN